MVPNRSCAILCQKYIKFYQQMSKSNCLPTIMSSECIYPPQFCFALLCFVFCQSHRWKMFSYTFLYWVRGDTISCYFLFCELINHILCSFFYSDVLYFKEISSFSKIWVVHIFYPLCHLSLLKDLRDSSWRKICVFPKALRETRWEASGGRS